MIWAGLGVGALVIAAIVYSLYKVSGASSGHRNALERAHKSETKDLVEKNEELTRINNELTVRVSELEKLLFNMRRKYEDALNKVLLKLGPGGIDDVIRSSLRKLSKGSNENS